MGRTERMTKADYERLEEALPYMTDWDRMLVELERLDDHNPYLRKLAPKIPLAECVDECRQLFGEDFLPGAVRRRHPFLAMVPVPMGTAPAHLRWFVEAVRLVRKADNWESMRSGLTSMHRFNSKASELELAANFVRGGFDVTLEPRVQIGDRYPEPDMLIRCPRHEADIYVEVTGLADTEEERAAEAMFDKVTDSRVLGFNATGRVFDVVEGNALDDLVGQLEAFMAEAKASGEFREFVENPAVELAVANDRSDERLQAWASARGMDPGEIHGASVDPRTLLRLGRKIMVKSHRQLPKEARSLLFIRANELFQEDFEITRTLDFLRLRVTTHPTLLGVFFTTGHYEPGVKTGNGTAAPGFPFYRRQRADGVCRDYILVPNDRHLTYTSLGLWEQIVRAL